MAFGWQPLAGDWRREEGELRVRSLAGDAAIAKGPALGAYELVVNGRLVEAAGPQAGWGVRPAVTEGDPGPLLLVERDPVRPEAWCLAVEHQVFPLPGFDPAHHQHLRLRREGSRLTLRWESLELGEIAVPAAPARPVLHVRQAAAAFDAVRLSAIPSRQDLSSLPPDPSLRSG